MENLKALVHRGRGRTEEGQWLLVNTQSESSTDEDFSLTKNPIRSRSHLVESRAVEVQEGSRNNSSEEMSKSTNTSVNKTEQIMNRRLRPQRRNAICDELERGMYCGPKSLRKEREDLLRCITLGNYSLL